MAEGYIQPFWCTCTYGVRIVASVGAINRCKSEVAGGSSLSPSSCDMTHQPIDHVWVMISHEGGRSSGVVVFFSASQSCSCSFGVIIRVFSGVAVTSKLQHDIRRKRPLIFNDIYHSALNVRTLAINPFNRNVEPWTGKTNMTDPASAAGWSCWTRHAVHHTKQD